jgi:hypothetical protein
MSVRIVVPTRGRPDCATVTQLEKIARKYGLPQVRYERSHLSSADCRNKIVRWLMEETSDDVIMCDDDVIPPDNVLQLAAHGLPIVAAPTFLVNSGANVPFLNVYRDAVDATGQAGYFPLDRQFSLKGLQVVHDGVEHHGVVGTGCIFISRRVFHKLHELGLAAFFFVADEWGVNQRSEDMAFCERVRPHFPIHADFDVVCEHNSTIGLLGQHMKFVETMGRAVALSQQNQAKEMVH